MEKIGSLVLIILFSLPFVHAQAQWQSLNGGVNWQVRSFAISSDGDKLLVGGGFTFVYQDSLRANSVAWWDGSEWSIEDLAGGNGDVSPNGNYAPTFSLAIKGDTIFAGHLYDSWHGDVELGFATMLVGGEWQPCGSPENWFFLLHENGRLFNGGRADTLYGQYMPLVNEWIDHQWQPLPNSPFNNTGTIYDATYWNGNYYFVGSFLAGSARSAIRFNGVDQWTSLGDGIGGNYTSKVCGFGDSLYVGGFLPIGPNVVSRHIQIWDGEEWKPFFPQVDMFGQIMDIHVHEGALYISAGFRFWGDTTQYGVLRYDGHQLCAIGGNMPLGANKIAFFQDHLYMAMPPNQPGFDQEQTPHIGYRIHRR